MFITSESLSTKLEGSRSLVVDAFHSACDTRFSSLLGNMGEAGKMDFTDSLLREKKATVAGNLDGTTY
jgi:hypothetical protein